MSEDPSAPSDRASEPHKGRDIGEIVQSAGPAAAASYTLVGAVIGLGAAGWALDRWWQTSPWGLLGGLLLGMVVGFYELVKTTRR